MKGGCNMLKEFAKKLFKEEVYFSVDIDFMYVNVRVDLWGALVTYRMIERRDKIIISSTTDMRPDRFGLVSGYENALKPGQPGWETILAAMVDPEAEIWE